MQLLGMHLVCIYLLCALFVNIDYILLLKDISSWVRIIFVHLWATKTLLFYVYGTSLMRICRRGKL